MIINSIHESYLGKVKIPSSEPLANCAALLNGVLKGFTLEFDEDYRFDEIPAFIAERDGLEMVLFGHPDGEFPGWYLLQFRTIYNPVPRDWQAAAVPTFLNGRLTKHPPHTSGRILVSDELAGYLRENGIEGCVALKMP